MWGSVLTITWTRAVISCRVNRCWTWRPVFKKNLVLTSQLTAVLLRLPQTLPPANSIFYYIDIGDSPMFQQAPMSPIFNVRCVHRPNSSFCCLWLCQRCAVSQTTMVSVHDSLLSPEKKVGHSELMWCDIMDMAVECESN